MGIYSNNLADALSRNRLHDFKSHFPQAQAVPTPIPPEVILLILSKPDWTQQSWTRLWTSIFERVYIANSTQRTYQQKKKKKRYIQFCLMYDFVPLLVPEQQLYQYTAWLANQGLTHKTLKTYLAAVRHLQIAEGLPDPKIASMPKLEQVMRGVKAHQARSTSGSQPRHPTLQTFC